MLVDSIWKTLFLKIHNPFFFFFVTISEVIKANKKISQDFFREEYVLNNAIGMCALLRALKMESRKAAQFELLKM